MVVSAADRSRSVCSYFVNELRANPTGFAEVSLPMNKQAQGNPEVCSQIVTKLMNRSYRDRFEVHLSADSRGPSTHGGEVGHSNEP